MRIDVKIKILVKKLQHHIYIMLFLFKHIPQWHLLINKTAIIQCISLLTSIVWPFSFQPTPSQPEHFSPILCTLVHILFKTAHFCFILLFPECINTEFCVGIYEVHCITRSDRSTELLTPFHHITNSYYSCM